MAYTKQTWTTGDTVTADKLNHMEDGIGSGSDKFIVMCTPTDVDYSGVMDKTVAEISAAYEAGQEIVFRVVTSATEYTDIPLAFASVINPFAYMNFSANLFYAVANTLVVMETGATDVGTQQTYGTTIYALTPAS